MMTPKTSLCAHVHFIICTPNSVCCMAARSQQITTLKSTGTWTWQVTDIQLTNALYQISQYVNRCSSNIYILLSEIQAFVCIIVAVITVAAVAVNLFFLWSLIGFVHTSILLTWKKLANIVWSKPTSDWHSLRSLWMSTSNKRCVKHRVSSVASVVPLSEYTVKFSESDDMVVDRHHWAWMQHVVFQ